VDIDQIAQLAVELADGAAQLVASRSLREQRVTTKSGATDLVTETDQASEAWIVEQIKRVRPDDAVLGEEGGERTGTSGVRWVIDPIDGTTNFVVGYPYYSVSIAAEYENQVVAAAVANPATGELYHAALGRGAYQGGQRLNGPRSVPLSSAVVCTGFAYDPGRRTRQAALIAQLLPRVADIRRFGSAALDMCHLAAGRLDAFFEVGLNPWDYSAGALVAREAGCVTRGLGDELASTRLTVAASPELMPELRSLLIALGADEVL
jgi:myo-inositol-1(or 4)-monophosphatase